jgi:uncharacterized Tic20 family protein
MNEFTTSEPTQPAESPPPLDSHSPNLPPALLPPGAPGTVSDEDRTLSMLCHLLGILTGFLGPLVLWLVKKDSSPFLDHHGREALNFQITVMLVMLALGSVTFVLMFFIIGILLVPVMMIVGILALVAEIIAAIAAQKGEWHRYPFCLRLV